MASLDRPCRPCWRRWLKWLRRPGRKLGQAGLDGPEDLHIVRDAPDDVAIRVRVDIDVGALLPSASPGVSAALRLRIPVLLLLLLPVCGVRGIASAV